jgi:coproporphyrinogen III oxidase-like Fe-S oxidoreductase
MRSQEGIQEMGGTMRLGAYPCKLRPGSRVAQAYGALEVSERHRHRYEVSNWARGGGFESRHNQAYWRCRPVYGAGAGAHTYATDGTVALRWWNVARPREYIAAAPSPKADGEELAARKAVAESLMLGLRTAEGMIVPAGFDDELMRLEKAGLVQRSNGRIRPTRRGMDLHNQIALAVL